MLMCALDEVKGMNVIMIKYSETNVVAYDMLLNAIAELIGQQSTNDNILGSFIFAYDADIINHFEIVSLAKKETQPLSRRCYFDGGNEVMHYTLTIDDEQSKQICLTSFVNEITTGIILYDPMGILSKIQKQGLETNQCFYGSNQFYFEPEFRNDIQLKIDEVILKKYPETGYQKKISK